MQKNTQAGFVNPHQVLKKIDLKSSTIAADFGCGSGGWVIPLAKKLKHGKVYGIDILKEPLSALKGKLKMENSSLPIETMKANVEKKTPISRDRCNLVLMANLLFQVEDIKGVFKEADRVLNDQGRILIVEWRKDANQGPDEKVSKEKIKKIAKESGFKIEEEFKPGNYHYAMILTK